MNVPLTAPPPSTKELVAVLRQEFSEHYSYRLFGLGNAKSIIVRKSTFVGAQISINAHEIAIRATPPSILAGFLNFFRLTELGEIWSLPPQWSALEREIGTFLKHKYN
jgi:hypothetical protein